MTTPKRNEAVAVIGPVWSLMWIGRDSVAETVRQHGLKIGDELVPASAYAALQGEVSRLRAFAEHVRTTCFDFVNEGIRPWEHHMRELAWRADKALNLEPPTDGQ